MKTSLYGTCLYGLVLLCAPVVAQNTTRLGLQGDAVATTAGGWVAPAAHPGNPFSVNAPTQYQIDKQNLGKALFWDVQLSTDDTMSCGSCHGFGTGGTDGRPAGQASQFGAPSLGAFGVIPQSRVGANTIYGFNAPSQETPSVTPFHTPTMVGAYMNRQQLWQKNASNVFNFAGGSFNNWSSLESQAAGPPTNQIEMAHQGLVWSPNQNGAGPLEDKLGAAAPLATVVPGSVPASIPTAWLTMSYDAVFDQVFAADPNPVINAANGATRVRVAMAIASYERTLVPDQAPIDTNTMTAQEVQGFNIVRNSGCFVCHSISGNPQLVNTGTPNSNGTLVDRWDNLMSDGNLHDIFGFGNPRQVPGGGVKTPTLRNLALRRRFFHDGRGRVVGGAALNTLPDIVDFYDIDQNPLNGGLGGVFELNGSGPNNSLTTNERNAVIAFLGNALTDPRLVAGTAPFDSPQLYHTLLPFESLHTRPATPAPAGWQPRMIVETPANVPKVGGPTEWKLGVSSRNATTGPLMPAGSAALLAIDVFDNLGGPLHLPNPILLGSSAVTPQGFATINAPVPLSLALVGVIAKAQWAVVDLVTSQIGWSEAATIFAF